MTNEKFDALLKQWHQEEKALGDSKGHDYADDSDRLGNFRRMHQMCHILDIRPGEREEDVYLFYILFKIDRMANLLHAQKRPENEPVSGSIVDARVYLSLLSAWLVENDWHKPNLVVGTDSAHQTGPIKPWEAPIEPWEGIDEDSD